MRRYRNLSGDSGVAAYELGDGWILVEFVPHAGREARRYRYTDASAGAEAVADMQALARAGRGLSTYIAQNDPPYED